MSRDKIDKKILDKIMSNPKIGDMKLQSVRDAISKIHKDNHGTTMNAAASEFAKRKGFTVYRYLNDTDKSSLQHLKSNPVDTGAIIRRAGYGRRIKTKSKEKIIEFIKYNTSDSFRKDHINEVNRAYTYRCYTSAFILCRKIIENMLVDVLRHKFPPTSQENKELYYDIRKKRIRDFSEILDNLNKKSHEFEMDKALVEKIVTVSKPFKKDANDKAHSWFHIVKSKKEIDDINVQNIINLISKLENNIGM